MHATNHSPYRLFPFLSCCLLCLFLLAACSSGASTVTPTPTSGEATPVATNPAVTPTSPATQTSCPAVGTARAAKMPPLALGSHQNIVYIVNEGTQNAPTFGTLKRYDVTNGSKAEIIKLANTTISDAQVSADGQWILFVASVAGQDRLQLIRLDGNDLQTLYCGSVRDALWSSDQKLAIFVSSENGRNGEFFNLLNMQNGSLQPEFSFGGASFLYLPVTWLDNTRVYLNILNADGPIFDVYILNTGRGPNQTESDLSSVQQPYTNCADFDSSYDSTHLFISHCNESSPFSPTQFRQGPSSIVVEPATGGGTPHTIYSSATLAITAVRSISQTTLLFFVSNLTGDTSHNGLWKIHTDGTGLTRLTKNDLAFNTYTRNPWSNASRDGSMYAMANSAYQGNTLFFGSLNGGGPTTFASISDGTQLSIVGWTTM